MTPQVPAAAPLAIVQMPVQQSVGAKQMSPSELQAAPDDAHTPAAQLPEQQSVPVAQWLPRLVQLADEPWMAAHVEPAQLSVQQSPLPPHAPPIGLHSVAPHCPLLQTPSQQSVGLVHAAPATAQAPPMSAHCMVVVSQAPVQQPAPLTQL
jgi:hypothetical protein